MPVLASSDSPIVYLLLNAANTTKNNRYVGYTLKNLLKRKPSGRLQYPQNKPKPDTKRNISTPE